MPSLATSSLPSFDGENLWESHASSSRKSENITSTSRRAEPVRDAWDDEDDEESGGEEPADNATLWQRAESQTPMPSIVFASPSTSSISVPAAALQQKQAIRILRRPNGSNSSSAQTLSSEETTKSNETFRNRQAAYDAARARIFGTTETSLSRPSSPKLGDESPDIRETPDYTLPSRRDSQDRVASSVSVADSDATLSQLSRDDERILYPRRSDVSGSVPLLKDDQASSIIRQPRGPAHSTGSSIGFNAYVKPAESLMPEMISREGFVGSPGSNGNVNGRNRGTGRRKGGRGRAQNTTKIRLIP